LPISLSSNHQLRLSRDVIWEDEWFKDEGGRDKGISLTVELLDATGTLVSNRRLPLKVVLVYQTGQEAIKKNKSCVYLIEICSWTNLHFIQVARQDILKIVDTPEIIVQGGKAEIKARIEEVSLIIMLLKAHLTTGPTGES